MSSSFNKSQDADDVLSIHDLSKVYHLYSRPSDRLKQFVYPRVKRLLGRPVNNYYAEFWALKNVSFNVRRGETVGIVGRNGSGKSTLLQLIAGTLAPTLGTVQAHGRVAALLELGAGFNPEFTGRENIYFNAAILGMSRKEIDEHIEDIIAFADVGAFIDQPVKTYSSGMYVRVAFSTAINVNPDILIVDEALSVGDTAFQQKCLHRIRQMQERGVSILLVTHSNNILLEYCDRGIFLKHGQVLFDGEARDAVRSYGLDVLKDEGAQTAQVGSLASQGEQDKFLSSFSQDAFTGDSEGPAMEISAVSFLNTHGAAASSFEYGAQVQIVVDLIVRKPIPLPAFGIQIASTEAIVLWTSITTMMNLQLPPLEPGRYALRWVLRANFAGNRYVVALGAGHMEGGGYKRIHRADGLHFDVLPVPFCGEGWLAPEPGFEVARA